MNNPLNTTFKALLITTSVLSLNLMAGDNSAKRSANQYSDLKARHHLSGNIASIAYQSCYPKNQDDVDKQQTTDCKPTEIIFFDEQGKETGKQTTDPTGKLLTKTLIEQQGKHQELHRTIDANGNFLAKTVVIRSATDGKIIETQDFYGYKRLQFRTTITYNPDNTVQKTAVLDREGNLQSKAFYTYNDKQQLVEEKEIGIASKYSFEAGYAYDRYGNLIDTGNMLYQLELDEKNNWKQRKVYRPTYQERLHSENGRLNRTDYRTITYRD